MADNPKTDWELAIAEIIVDLYLEKLDPITVDEVQPQMVERGYDMPRDELTTAIGIVAADNDWQISMTDDGSIQVVPG
jgi:hypothetical protein